MIQVNEKTAKSFTKLMYKIKTYYWNLYNPNTKELLTSNILKNRDEFPFNKRPDSWEQYGVVDLCGVDVGHNLVWMKRVEKYLNQGFYFCTLNKNPSDRAICDCINIGYDIDEKGNVIPFGQ